jgi:hypothetical protein
VSSNTPSNVAEDTFMAAGVTVTGAQLAALIAQVADQWRAEDNAAATAGWHVTPTGVSSNQ